MSFRRRIKLTESRNVPKTQKRRAAVWCAIEKLESRCLLTSVLSAHYDLTGDSVDSTETLLTPTTVNTTSFGKQFSTPLDGQAYGQPLYVPGVDITSGTQQGSHNVIYVVTENDSLYAIDADGGNILWQDSFLSAANAGVNLLGASSITTVPNGDVGSTDITPQIGVTATPAISLSANAIYVEAKTKQIIGGNTNAPNYVQTLFKVDIGSGAIDASIIIGDTVYSNGAYTYRVTNTTGTGTDPYVNGTGDGAITSQGSVTWGGTSRVYFNALRAMDRPGITLYDGQVYLSFASHGDNGPYHGWLLRYDANTLALTGVLNTTPNGGEAGIWQGGGPISIDSDGNIYFETGNGSFNTSASNFGPNYTGLPLDADYGDSFVKVVNDPTSTQSNPNPNGWGLKITDFFSPTNNASLNTGDTDLGSAGPLVLPDAVGSAAHPHLLIGAGKEGVIYLIDRDDMGGFNPTADRVVQETGANAIGGALSSPAFFLNNPNGSTPSGILYYQSDYGGYLQSFTISNGSFTALADSPDYYSSSLDGSPTISANGTATPIVWALYRAGNQLRAYNALNLNDEIWTTSSNSSGADALSGNITKFSSPTVADGLVMVADDSYLNVYGPPVPPTSPPAAPAGVTVSSTVYNAVVVDWQDLSNNEDSFYIERSTDQTNWSVVGVVSANVTTYTDNTALATTTYYYRVRAHNSYDGGSYSAYAYSPAITTPAAPPIGVGDGLLATYYENDGGAAPLSGPVVLLRDDPSINFNWAGNAPAPGVSQSDFSVVWTGTVQPNATGSYTFSTDTDDGCRLYINGNLVINDWVNQAATIESYVMTLTAGQTYSITMDYYQAGGLAQAQLLWAPPRSSQVPVPFVGGYAVGSYHNDDYLRGPAALSRVETTVDSNINWSNGSPTSQIPNTNFSASWSGEVQAQYSENYTFYVTGDDGYNLWINGQLVISNWVDEPATTETATILMSAGQKVPIELDYFQDGGADEAQLQWSSSHTPQEDIPQAQLYSGVAPAAPSNLMATPTSGTQLTLTWQSNSTIQTGFLIQREVDGTNSWQTIGTVGPSVTSYPDTNLSPGTTYDYQVQATNFEANSPFSSPAVITMPTIPQTPTNAHPSNITTTSIVANWTDRASNATGYRVGIATGDADFDYILVNNPNLSTYEFDGLTAGTEYDVHVSAYNIAGYNDFTGFTTTTLTLPPTGLNAVAGNGQINLTWTAPALNAPDFPDLTFNIYRGTSSGGEGSTPYVTGLTSPSFTDTNLTPGATYYYTVTAVDTGGESAASGEAFAPAIAEDFAVQNGSTLNANLSSAGAVTLAPVAGGGISASQNGVQVTFTGITGISVSDSGINDVLNVSGVLTQPFTLANAGTSLLNVTNGSIIIAAAPGQTAQLGSLSLSGASATISAGSTPAILQLNALSIDSTSTLDITDNEVLLNYPAASPISRIAGYIRTGFNAGAWNGPGIISSTAQSPTNGLLYGVGFADGQDGIVAGLLPSQIEIKYTLLGDANLDGVVNGSDFSILAANFGQGYTNWDQGNFLFTSAVNGADFSALAANFGQDDSYASIASAGGSSAASTTTPTPSTAVTESTTEATTTSFVTPETTTTTTVATPESTTPKSQSVSVSKAAPPGTTKAKSKKSALQSYAAALVTTPTVSSTNATKSADQDGKFLADR